MRTTKLLPKGASAPGRADWKNTRKRLTAKVRGSLTFECSQGGVIQKDLANLERLWICSYGWFLVPVPAGSPTATESRKQSCTGSGLCRLQ